MKLTILREFRDKNTGELYKKGTVKEFEEARATELLADPRKLVEEKKTKRKK